MKDTTTYKTARKLADAGFPQPAPAPGQWWAVAGELVYISASRPSYFTVVRFLAGARPLVDEYFDKGDFNGLVYLPTVTDLLHERYTLYRRQNTWHVCPPDGDDFNDWEHESAAEAAALAYLELNEKNT